MRAAVVPAEKVFQLALGHGQESVFLHATKQHGERDLGMA
jgi:hypothetical protein